MKKGATLPADAGIGSNDPGALRRAERKEPGTFPVGTFTSDHQLPVADESQLPTPAIESRPIPGGAAEIPYPAKYLGTKKGVPC